MTEKIIKECDAPVSLIGLTRASVHGWVFAMHKLAEYPVPQEIQDALKKPLLEGTVMVDKDDVTEVM